MKDVHFYCYSSAYPIRMLPLAMKTKARYLSKSSRGVSSGLVVGWRAWPREDLIDSLEIELDVQGPVAHLAAM